MSGQSLIDGLLSIRLDKAAAADLIVKKSLTCRLNLSLRGKRFVYNFGGANTVVSTCVERSTDKNARFVRLSDRNREFEAQILLSRSTGLRLLGCRFERGLTGSIIVIVNNKPVGTWWYQDGAFHFSNEARAAGFVSARSASDVVSETVGMISAIADRSVRHNSFAQSQF